MSARSCIFVLGFTLLSTLAPAQLPQAASARLDPTLLELPAIEEKDVILVYSGFVVNYNTEQLISNWVAYELTAKELGGEVPRARGFSMDLAYSGRQAMLEVCNHRSRHQLAENYAHFFLLSEYTKT